MRPKAFHELWALAEELAAAQQIPFGLVFDCGDVGLLLSDKVGPLAYDDTPLNSDTFAQTGGDGVHFGFLDVGSSECSPIVMTVPMAREEKCNHILGDTLIEFLALGCRFGYFNLEQLAYDRDATIRDIERASAAAPLSPLDHIARRFDLHPWPDVRGRLDQLRDLYYAAIRLPHRE